jgi:hypothetical protein
MNRIVLFAAASIAAVALAVCAAAGTQSLRDKWSAQEIATMASMQLKEAGPRPADPSNEYEADPRAAALGWALSTIRASVAMARCPVRAAIHPKSSSRTAAASATASEPGSGARCP